MTIKTTLTKLERAELDKLKTKLPQPVQLFNSQQEAHDFMLNEVFRPCFQQLKTEGCFPTTQAFMRQSLALWREVFSNYAPKDDAAS